MCIMQCVVDFDYRSFLFCRANNKDSQLLQFWKGADFGYVLERREEMKLMCVPETKVIICTVTFTKISHFHFLSEFSR